MSANDFDSWALSFQKPWAGFLGWAKCWYELRGEQLSQFSDDRDQRTNLWPLCNYTLYLPKSIEQGGYGAHREREIILLRNDGMEDESRYHCFAPLTEELYYDWCQKLRRCNSLKVATPTQHARVRY